MDDKELNEIEARANAAPDGPWEAEFYNPSAPPYFYGYVIGDSNQTTILKTQSGSHEETARFVAHARTDVPKLLTEVRRLRGLLKDVEKMACKCDYPESSGCFWCEQDEFQPHHCENCPAFHQDGTVK